MDAKIRRRIVITLVIVGLILPVVIVAAGLGYMAAVPMISQWRHQIPFDSSVWKARSRDAGMSWPTRLRMVNDLLERQKLTGRTKESLVELLGQPDSIEELRNRYHGPDAQRWNMAYHLGPERGFMSIDDEWLVFQLDRSSTVARVGVITD